MNINKGDRVGAIQSANAEEVKLFGYGVYEGDEIPSKEENELLHNLKLHNPKILLDNGLTVWGFQCWWGPEDEIKHVIGERRVLEVSK